MQVIILLLLFITACSPFSNSEKRLLEESCTALSSISNLRDKETDAQIHKTDIDILMEGEKDRNVFIALDSTLAILKGIRLNNLKNEDKKTLKNLIDESDSELSINNTIFPAYNSPMDSILCASWRSQLREDITINYASRVGSTYCGFYTVKPFIEPNSRIIEQGQPYRAKFFLGGKSFCLHIIGEGIERNSSGKWELNYLPDQSEKYGIWKGKAICLRDTLDIQIPYEIKYCK